MLAVRCAAADEHRSGHIEQPPRGSWRAKRCAGKTPRTRAYIARRPGHYERVLVRCSPVQSSRLYSRVAGNADCWPLTAVGTSWGHARSSLRRRTDSKGWWDEVRQSLATAVDATEHVDGPPQVRCAAVLPDTPATWLQDKEVAPVYVPPRLSAEVSPTLDRAAARARRPYGRDRRLTIDQ